MSKKLDPTIWWLLDTHFSLRDTNRLTVKGKKKVFQANANQKRVGGGGYIVLVKIDFQLKLVSTDKDHCIMIKGSVHQEAIIIVNTYVPTIEHLNM